MKLFRRLLAGLLLILTEACASLPGVSIVTRPELVQAAPPLPPPEVCLADPETPAELPLPSLPNPIPAPIYPVQETTAWWRGAALFFQNVATRAQMAQAFGANVAENERDARISDAAKMVACATALRAREGHE